MEPLYLDRITLVGEPVEDKKDLSAQMAGKLISQGDYVEFKSTYVAFKCEPVLSGYCSEETEIIVLDMPLDSCCDSPKISFSDGLGTKVNVRTGKSEYGDAACRWDVLSKIEVFDGCAVQLASGDRMVQVNLFGSDTGDFNCIYLNETQQFNLLGSLDANEAEFMTNANVPVASTLTISRVATPASSNSSIFTAAVDKLKHYFSSPRIVQNGDLLCIEVNVDEATLKSNIRFNIDLRCLLLTIAF
jgi:hypothetical protein